MAFSHAQKYVAILFIVAAMSLSLAAHATNSTGKLLPGPENYRPEPGSVVFKSSVALQWQFFEGANLFRVQAAHSKDFNVLFLDDTSIYHYYILNDLPQDETRIFWRVRACTLTEGNDAALPESLECLSDWSKAYSFYSSKPDSTGREPEKDTNFFRRLFGCSPSNKSGGLLPTLADLLPLGISILIVSKLRNPHGKI